MNTTLTPPPPHSDTLEIGRRKLEPNEIDIDRIDQQTHAARHLEEPAPLLLPILVGAAAAMLGALLWFGIAVLSGYEVGYVAWAVGTLVGAGCVQAGGRGPVLAAAAAVLVLASLFGGKMATVQHFLGESTAQLAVMFDHSAYDLLHRQAKDFASIDAADDAKLRTFIHRHRYSDADTPNDITGPELAAFREVDAPSLAGFAANPPAFEAWQASIVEDFTGQANVAEIACAGLSGIDLLFALLGVVTAARMVAGRTAPA